MAVATDKERGVQNRGVPGAPAWATEPPVWGEPIGFEHLRKQFEEMGRERIYRYAYPDGSKYETNWNSESAAKAWASINGHRYLGEVEVERPVERTPERTPRDLGSRGTEPSLSPPPLVKAVLKPKPKPKPPDPGQKPLPTVKSAPPELPKPRPTSPVPPAKDDYGIIEYLRDDFIHTTMTESMPLIAKWFGRVGKGLGYVPGLKGVGKAYEAIGQIADGMQLLYELVHEVKQDEALAKGSKQLIKRTKPVKKIAESLLKKKYPGLPEPVRKKLAELLEDAFEKYISDPAIEEGKEEIRKLDEGKDLDKTLYDQLKKTLSGAPVLR